MVLGHLVRCRFSMLAFQCWIISKESHLLKSFTLKWLTSFFTGRSNWHKIKLSEYWPSTFECENFKSSAYVFLKCSHWPDKKILVTDVNQASTDGLSYICPHFDIFNGPSSKTVHEVDGPPQNDNLGPASEFVHEMDGRCINFGPLSTGTSGPSAEGHLRPWWPDVNDRWANDDDFATMNFIIAGLSMMLFFNTLAVYLKIRSINRANKIQITLKETEKQDDTETVDLWICHVKLMIHKLWIIFQ